MESLPKHPAGHEPHSEQYSTGSARQRAKDPSSAEEDHATTSAGFDGRRHSRTGPELTSTS